MPKGKCFSFVQLIKKSSNFSTWSINYVTLNAERYVAPLPEREIVYNNK